eukprot:1184619-Prorocentrum_minimum.AAC.2
MCTVIGSVSYLSRRLWRTRTACDRRTKRGPRGCAERRLPRWRCEWESTAAAKPSRAGGGFLQQSAVYLRKPRWASERLPNPARQYHWISQYARSRQRTHTGAYARMRLTVEWQRRVARKQA